MLQEMCLASMLAINCLSAGEPTDDCNIPVKQVWAYVTKTENASNMVLVGGVSGWNRKSNEVFRSWWKPRSKGVEGIVLHFVPEEQICAAMTLEEYEVHKREENRRTRERGNSTRKPTI